MRTIILLSLLILAGCDDKETVYIPLAGFKPYKEQVTRQICARFPPGATTSRQYPQMDIIHKKCEDLGYPIATEPDPNYVPPCQLGEQRIPPGYHLCNF